MGQFMMGMTARLDQLQRSGRHGLATPASFAPFALASAFAEESHQATGEALLGMDSLADVLASPTRFWAAPLGFGASGGGSGGGSEARLGGFMLGLDHRLSESLTIGAVGGWSSGSYEGGAEIASRRFAGGHVGAYALWERGAFYLSGQAGYARHEGTQARLIAGPGSLEFARADLGYQTASGQLEFGWRADLGPLVLTPFAGLGWRGWQQDGAQETSRTTAGTGGVYALRQEGRRGASAPVSLGMRAETSWVVGEGLLLDGHLRAAWVRQSGDLPATRAAMALAPGEGFAVGGAPLSRDAVSFQAGVQLQAHARLGFGIVAMGEFGDRSQSLGGFGRMVYRW
jgi:outer membrane autotransporter protein